MDFYITLPSNVVSYDFENTIANYKTRLCKRLILDGDWECGLASISYTKSWYTVNENDYVELIYWRDDTGENRYRIPNFGYKGKYEKIEELLDRLNQMIHIGMQVIINETHGYNVVPAGIYDEDINTSYHIKDFEKKDAKKDEKKVEKKDEKKEINEIIVVDPKGEVLIINPKFTIDRAGKIVTLQCGRIMKKLFILICQ